jgi:hypothetical protein
MQKRGGRGLTSIQSVQPPTARNEHDLSGGSRSSAPSSASSPAAVQDAQAAWCRGPSTQIQLMLPHCSCGMYLLCNESCAYQPVPELGGAPTCSRLIVIGCATLMTWLHCTVRPVSVSFAALMLGSSAYCTACLMASSSPS